MDLLRCCFNKECVVNPCSQCLVQFTTNLLILCGLFALCRQRLELMRHIYNEDLSPNSPEAGEDFFQCLTACGSAHHFSFYNLIPSRCVVMSLLLWQPAFCYLSTAILGLRLFFVEKPLVYHISSCAVFVSDYFSGINELSSKCFVLTQLFCIP